MYNKTIDQIVKYGYSLRKNDKSNNTLPEAVFCDTFRTRASRCAFPNVVSSDNKTAKAKKN